MLRRLAAVAVLLAMGAVVAAGCGSGSAATDDPAAVVPRSALFYLEATLRPQGDAHDGALAAAGKILDTRDPAARIRALLSDALSSDGPRIDYARDIDPWLGDRAAVWADAPPRAGADPLGAAAIAVSDEDAARAKIEELARRGGERLAKRSVDGVDYEVNSDGDAIAVHDGFAYVGQEAAVRRALTAGDDGRLSDEKAYRDALSDLPDDRLATFFLDTPRLFDAALASEPQAEQRLGALRSLFGTDSFKPVAGAFAADADRLTIETVAQTAGGLSESLGGLTGGAPPALLKDLPGDSWAALGVPKAGATLRGVFGRFAGAFGAAAAENRLRQELGLDLQRDVLSWMGDAAVFVRGTSPDTLDGALVVEITDEDRAARGFGKIVGVARTRGELDAQPVRVPGADAAFDLGVRDASRPLILARGHGRMVLAYGRAAAAAALEPSSRLGDADTYRRAKDALDGYEPSLLVSVPAILSLVEASGSGDAEFEQAKRYLDALDVVASGGRREGDKVRSRIAIGLR